RRSWICSPVKMIFRKQSTSGNIIKECSSTEVAVEYLRQITEDNFMEAKNILDVARIFECLFSLPDYNKYPEFINIFLVLVTGYNKEK
ncbi:MAG: hypothetical protein SOT18_00020, partial [Eubacterium sp.]|nr:hypothetical protein [Eubacterium sp.]